MERARRVSGRTESKANISLNGHEYNNSPQFLRSAISVAPEYGLTPVIRKLSPGGDLDFKEVPCAKYIKEFELWKRRQKKKNVFFSRKRKNDRSGERKRAME